MTPEQRAFLRKHRLRALMPARCDGSPQLSWIAYDYEDIELWSGRIGSLSRE